MTLNHSSLPDWVYEPMPNELTETGIISWSKEFQEFVVHYGKNHNFSTPFNNIDEAYDFIRNNRDAQVIFDESVDGHQGELDDGMFFCANHRLLIEFTDTDSLDLLQNHMDEFQKLNNEYLEDQGDWALAYNWLSLHPVFWTHYRGFHWETNYGLEAMWTSVCRGDSNNDTMVCFEHGGHMEPDYRGHYHDIRLDVCGKNFEDAYVKLAKKVHEHFDSFGVERTTSA